MSVNRLVLDRFVSSEERAISRLEMSSLLILFGFLISGLSQF
jgi:hypothetical protein